MPLIHLKTSNGPISNSENLLNLLSQKLSELTGKPEQYVMTLLQENVPMTFGGTVDPCCYVEIKSIGSLHPREMTESFCNLIASQTGIPKNRIYICFEDKDPKQWGFNGQTFG